MSPTTLIAVWCMMACVVSGASGTDVEAHHDDHDSDHVIHTQHNDHDDHDMDHNATHAPHKDDHDEDHDDHEKGHEVEHDHHMDHDDHEKGHEEEHEHHEDHNNHEKDHDEEHDHEKGHQEEHEHHEDHNNHEKDHEEEHDHEKGHEEEHEHHEDHNNHEKDHEEEHDHEEHDNDDEHDHRDNHGASADANTSTSENTGDWGLVIAASFITTTPTLLGVFGASCAMRPRLQAIMKAWEPSLDSFASGVLFAAAVFLLLPEALHKASAGHSEEVVGTWTWGTSILLGWLTCTLIHHCSSIIFAKLDAQGEGEVDVERATSKLISKNWMSIAGPVLFGDFFHNFADGFVLAAAFKNCSPSFAWELVAITIAHEVPQELVDFFLLTNAAGMRWQWATLANFMCSVSTVFGALIAYGANVGSNEEGYILAFGAGVYLFIAATELGSKVVDLKEEPAEDVKSASVPNFAAAARRLVPFALGCVAIGLVLLNHEHCSGSSSADASTAGVVGGAHAGHNH